MTPRKGDAGETAAYASRVRVLPDVCWTTKSGSEFKIGMTIWPHIEEARFDITRGHQEHICSNLTSDAAEALRDNLDEFLDSRYRWDELASAAVTHAERLPWWAISRRRSWLSFARTIARTAEDR